jgi:gamma-tubulin complex component 3
LQLRLDYCRIRYCDSIFTLKLISYLLFDLHFTPMFHFNCRGKGKPKSKSKPKDTGSWFDGSRKAMIQLAGELFWKMGEVLDSIAKDHTTSLDAFITQLPMQQHVNLKFLLFRLDFTEYYGHVSSNN